MTDEKTTNHVRKDLFDESISKTCRLQNEKKSKLPERLIEIGIMVNIHGHQRRGHRDPHSKQSIHCR